MSEVTDLINELRAGSKSLDQVAERFRTRTWPGRPHAEDADELMKRSDEDPEPAARGSFDEVVFAFDRNRLTEEEFETLRQATAEGIKARSDRQRD